jgi:hypothetical protein
MQKLYRPGQLEGLVANCCMVINWNDCTTLIDYAIDNYPIIDGMEFAHK